MEAFDRILVRMPNWIGDVVMATPLLRTLRESQPRARLDALVLPSGVPVLAGLPYVDELVPFDRKGRHAGFSGMRSLARDLRPRGYDLAVCCPNSFSSALLLRLAGIPRRMGWSYGGRGFLLTDRLVPEMRRHWLFGTRRGTHREPRPMPQYYLDLARRLGCEILSDHAVLASTQEGDDEVAAFLERHGVGREEPLVGLNIGAAFGPSKLWNPPAFARVAASLRALRGLRPIVLCGPGEEDLGRAVEQAVGGDVIATSADILSLAGLKSMVRHLALLVTTDTGPRHFAVAFDVPLVTVMGSTDPRMTDQPHARAETVRHEPVLDCMPCHEKVCPLQHHRCLEDLEPQRVVAAAERVLDLPPLDD